jgi:GNAT superfamily N-acetyltransferase
LPPERLANQHNVAGFRCGHDALDDWLLRQARGSEGRSARTYVVTTADRVVGYYCLAAGSISRVALPSAALRRNQPAVVPIVLLGRLAVDLTFAGRGIGGALLKDAIKRGLAAAEIIGARAILVHAIDERAALFYRKFGFVPSPTSQTDLLLPLETFVRALFP